MDRRFSPVLLLVIASVLIEAWKTSREERREIQELRRGIHYHSKRHMLPSDPEPKRRSVTQRPREMRKKPSGHLTPIEADDMDNDEVVSVAVGPPPNRLKFDKIVWKPTPKYTNRTANHSAATNLVRDILTELGREFLTRQVSEDFVFGQYIGNAMRNLTSDLRLKMQHEVLEIVVKYQKLNRGEFKADEKNSSSVIPDIRVEKKGTNETEDNWPDFSNLAKIVG